MKIKAYKINSFAKTTEGGNPAGVVLDADYLSELEMRKIAHILNFSETAFVMKSNCADYKVKFFTPNEEVDLCGHATIGAFYVLQDKGLIKSGCYCQETLAGVLDIEVREDATIIMKQNLPDFSLIIDKKEIAASLHIAVEDMLVDLPVQIVSTGLRDIIVPIRSLEVLNSINPDFLQIEEISRTHNVTGYHLFTLETLFNSAAHCRNFAPLFGIPEESATGTSNGALGCYLFKYDKIVSDSTENIIIEQGYSMKKPSEIVVSLYVKEKDIHGVKVGGKALNLSEILIEI